MEHLGRMFFTISVLTLFGGLLSACGGGGGQTLAMLPPPAAAAAGQTTQVATPVPGDLQNHHNAPSSPAPQSSGGAGSSTASASAAGSMGSVSVGASIPTPISLLGSAPAPVAVSSPGSTPAPTPVRVVAPVTTPTPTQVSIVPPKAAPIAGSGSSWINGQQVPSTFLNQAFRGQGPFYQQLPASPTLDNTASSALSYYFNGNPGFTAGWIDGNKSQQQYDYNFPMYAASSSDPLVTITCNHAASASCVDNGLKINMPALATQAGGSDQHLAVVEPNGMEYDFWLVSSNPPYANGSSFAAAGEAHFSVLGSTTASGFVAPGFDLGAATAGGIALSIGQTYTSELASGVINHAISLTFPCGTGAWVYPATQTTGVCANNQGIPLGSRVWWQPSDAQTSAMNAAPDMKTILIALHHYGGYFTDGGAGGASINGAGVGMGSRLENQEAYWLYGNGNDPALNYAASAPGWSHVVTITGVNRYVLSAAGGAVDFLDNLKVVAPCVTQGTC